MNKEFSKILIWLPSPLGDAVLATPAIKALRKTYPHARITCLSNLVNKQVLTPSPFFDEIIELNSSCPFKNARKLKKENFDLAILFKNSLSSAMSVFLARIPCRLGYSREARSFFLTDRLYPPKLDNGKYKPSSMVDYYMALSSWAGAEPDDNLPQLFIDDSATKSLAENLPQLHCSKKPLIIFVPGGAFGPSKIWPPERYAQLADLIIDEFNADILISVSPAEKEKKIASEIIANTRNRLYNLAETPLNLQQLKALISKAELVVTNDTGPRHVAIALKKKIVTLFGPNDPAWTDTRYENETSIIGKVECNYCQKPVCPHPPRKCMEAITVENVFDAARELLNK